MRKFFLYIITAFSLGFFSCAHELPLTGGDKDIKPPVAEKFDPPNNSTQFNSKKITIYFDEFVKLKDATKQILVSPPGTDYEVVEKGQSIQVTITSTLKQNTTYVINFGGAIVDNNEGNVLSDLVYTFSTGDVLDSLTETFLVLDAYTLKPKANVKVMLYENDIDSLPLTTVPYYASTTSESGKAIIGNMKPGTFKVFALEEDNKNYLYDKPNEGIGFIAGPVQTGDTIPKKILYFKEEVTNPKIQAAKMPSAGMVIFKFNGPIEKTQLSIITNNEVYDTSKFEYIGTKRDSAVYWFKPTIKKDTIKWVFTRKMGEKDTSRMYPKVINTFKNNQVTGAPAFKLTTTIPADFDFYKKLEIEFSTPVDSFGTDVIILKEEDKKIPFAFKPVNGVSRKFVLDYTLKPAKNYTVYFPKKSVKGIYGNYIDSSAFTFKTSNEKTYKILSMNILEPETKTGGAIIQIMDDKDNILDEQKFSWADSNLVKFKNLRQGSYRVRLIYDVNNNGQWDSGNYSEKRQPEKVVFFPQPIDIKPNFDYELEWRIMNKN